MNELNHIHMNEQEIKDKLRDAMLHMRFALSLPGRDRQASAKKRTSVMMNSKHAAETLRLAQCDGSHRHEQLVNGKAKQCEIYPEKFFRLICEGIRGEIADAK